VAEVVVGLTHTEEPPPRIVSDGQQVLLDSEVAGDEPFMLARNLPGVSCSWTRTA
jgi:tetraacyldisaccharide 4'-kinase